MFFFWYKRNIYLKSKFDMKEETHTKIKIHVILILFLIVLCFGCNKKESESDNEISKELKEKVEIKVPENVNDNAIEAPPFSDGIFPCSECHAFRVPNPAKRELTEWHEDISAMFNHDKENRWCLDCHDIKSRDSLKLASGKLLDFKESYKLCGQCHGDKLRDWKVGVHGKRKGEWNGKKEYLLCVHCHNPHSPKFQELTPEPPPIRQEEIK
jgi:hypothetical protein